LYHRTRHHKKVSAIAALCVTSDRKRIHLFFRLHPGENINGPLVLVFLRCLLRQLRGPLILIWDRLQGHRATIVQGFIQSESRLHAFFLPPYAPELNPVENVWSYLKYNRLANATVPDLPSLTDLTRSHARSVQRKPNLLQSFLKHCPLSF
jgi:transposase